VRTRWLAIPWILVTVLMATTAAAVGFGIAASRGEPTTIQLKAEVIGASGIGPGWRTASLQSRTTKGNLRTAQCFTDKTSFGGPSVVAHYLSIDDTSVFQEALIVPSEPPNQVIDTVRRCGVFGYVKDLTSGEVTKLHEMRTTAFDGIGDHQLGYVANFPDHGQRRTEADAYVSVGDTLAIFVYSGFATASQIASLVNRAAADIR
jgi:hypothetical protein